MGQGKGKTLPSIRGGNGEFSAGTVVGSEAKLFELAAVIPAKALEKVVRELPVLPRPVGQLVPREVIQTVRNKNTLIDVKGRGDSLRKHIDDVFFGVRPVVEFGPERVLPLLRRHLASRIRRMQQEAFELHLPYAPK